MARGSYGSTIAPQQVQAEPCRQHILVQFTAQNLQSVNFLFGWNSGAPGLCPSCPPHCYATGGTAHRQQPLMVSIQT